MKNKKLIVLVSIAVSLVDTALADGGIMGYGMMSGGMMDWGMGFWSLLGVALISFIFSVIFWLCYKWIAEGNKKRDKKRRKKG